MPENIDAAYIAAVVDQEDAGPRLQELLPGLATHPQAHTIVSQLLSWPEGTVRFWALGVAKRLFSRDDYIHALERAAKDSDDAVRDDAIAELADISPDRVRRLTRSLKARLNANTGPLEKVFILWTLAKMRATDALPQISAVRSKEPDWTKLARVADVVILYLSHGPQAVLDAIRHHSDHIRMEELCTLAWHVLATPSARTALDECVADAPDEECRSKCKEAIHRWAAEST